MTCLLYGIAFAGSGQPSGATPLRLPRGVGDVSVRLIEAHGLAAAVSAIDPSDATPSVGHALAYARVVEALHSNRAVVPVRFGCVLAEEAEVIELLRVRRAEYVQVLHVLDGCVEMGVRLLRTGPSISLPLSADAGGSRWGPGVAYLNERRALFAEQDRCVLEATQATDRLRAAVAGWFVRFKAERPDCGMQPTASEPIASAYFLVRRQTLEAFCDAFRDFRRTEPAALRLSGPWPPYNFVVPEELNG
jgi:hypothetical protein